MANPLTPFTECKDPKDALAAEGESNMELKRIFEEIVTHMERRTKGSGSFSEEDSALVRLLGEEQSKTRSPSANTRVTAKPSRRGRQSRGKR